MIAKPAVARAFGVPPGTIERGVVSAGVTIEDRGNRGSTAVSSAIAPQRHFDWFGTAAVEPSA